MTLKIQCLTIDSKDPEALAAFWASVLDYEITYRSPEDQTKDREVVISKPGDPNSDLLFIQVADDKVVKNRYHLDLRPEDRDAEVERVIGLGATKVDIGQGSEVTWVVLADPEGNEFCILRALTDEELAEEQS